MRYGPFFKIALFRHIGQRSKSCTYTVFLPWGGGGLKFSLFSVYGQRFVRYRPIFKIAIFGLETWPSAKIPEVAHKPSF